MGTTGNDKPLSGGAEQGTSESRRADNGPAAHQEPTQDSEHGGADNAVLLDEIETLLHELSSEFTAPDEASQPGAEKPEDSTPAAAATPSLLDQQESSDFDLGKPIDYTSDPSRYDYRRATESYQADVAIRSMARKLAPAHDHAAGQPVSARPSVPEAEVPASDSPMHDSRAAGEAAEPDDRPDGAQRRRRLRLRPARRVPGSRPEAQFSTYAGVNQASDEEWDPRPLRQHADGRQGYGVALGVGITLLVIAGTTGAFALIEPLNRLLPERVASIFNTEPQGPSDSENGDSEGIASVALASGKVISGDALTPQEDDQNRTNGVTDSQDGVKYTAAAAAEPTQEAATGLDKAAEPAVSNEPQITQIKAQPNVTSAGLAESIQARSVRTRTIRKDKSIERIDQDDVVQAILKDPKKRALAPVEDVEQAEITEADVNEDPVTTGAISSQVADERIIGANAVARQAAAPTNAGNADRVSKRTLETKQTVKVAGLAPNAPFGVIQGADGTTGQQTQSNTQSPQPGETKVARSTNTDLDTIDPGRTSPGRNGTGKSGSTVPGTSVEGLLARGHELLRQGDIASARLVFRRVVAMGDSRGAKGMGMTYDPKVYQGLPVAGLAADIEQAEIWYRKAREFSEVKPAPDASETERMPVSGN